MNAPTDYFEIEHFTPADVQNMLLWYRFTPRDNLTMGMGTVYYRGSFNVGGETMLTPTDARTMSLVTLLLLFYAIGRAFDSALACILTVATQCILNVVRYQGRASWTLPDGTIVTITYQAPGSALVSMVPIDGSVPLHAEFVLGDDEKEILRLK